MELPQLLVIADDLTGAADCGAACAGQGLATEVVLDEAGASPDADVLSVDANTRHLPAAQAAAHTAAVLRQYADKGSPLLFKKLDSTLRGNVAAELAAILEAWPGGRPRPVVILAPAFPAHGRTTVNGRQLVHGVPLEHTEMGRSGGDALASHLPGILQAAGLRSAPLALELVRSDSNRLRAAFSEASHRADVLVCDAETDADLRAIARASVTLGPGMLWAGSAGLACHVPAAAALAPGALAPASHPLAAGPTLFVAGSLSSITRAQVAALAASPGLACFEVPIHILLAGEQSPQWHDAARKVEKSLGGGSDTLVLPATDSSVDGGNGPRISAALARLLQPCAGIAGALVATGGETARAVFESWGIHRFRIRYELEPGFPLSVTAGWNRRLPVLTKAGAFGSANTLLHCRRFLQQLDRSGNASSST